MASYSPVPWHRVDCRVHRYSVFLWVTLLTTRSLTRQPWLTVGWPADHPEEWRSGFNAPECWGIYALAPHGLRCQSIGDDLMTDIVPEVFPTVKHYLM